MDLNTENKESIIEEYFESKQEEYEYMLEKQFKNDQDRKLVEIIIDEMEKCCRQEISENAKKIVRECLMKLDIAWSKEIDFWEKKFYRLGFIDGMRMSSDLKEEQNIIKDK